MHFVLFIVLGAGAFYDVIEHRIPNWWILTGVISGILLCVLESEKPVGAAVFLQESAGFLLRMAVVTAVFFGLFLCRMIGAGDIKMAALICGFLGLRSGVPAVFLGFLIGAFWSFLKLLATGVFFSRVSYFLAYFRRFFQTRERTAYYVPARDGYQQVIPLGLCLFLGTVAFAVLSY